jgi:PAS domain S-box-containing protein
LQQWETTGQIAPFSPGRHDVSDRFQIPQKLYGRQRETEILLAAFERVATAPPQSPLDRRRSKGRVELMFISGYAGIGKSALVQEIHKPITRRRGYFVSGKSDQFQRNVPYMALIQALESLIRQLLTESLDQIVVWREKLLAALGPNGQIVLDVIPDVEHIIGPQPAAAELSPTEAQNRFNLVFQNFIRVFSRPEHSLIIFLDDLQWVDTASLNLIKSMMTDPETQSLFLIGAYRDNEVGAGHPLLLTMNEIEQADVTINRISLSPLDLPNVEQFVADTLTCSPAAARPLAELMLAKTNGNPFFMNEFLKSLYTENLLSFDFQQGGWLWELAQIQAQDITDNVVELMADKVLKLKPQTQQVLKLAACIGHQFDLHKLAIVNEKSPGETAKDLWAAIATGLVLPLSDTYKLADLDVPDLANDITPEYKFTHDRVQQAAYSLIPTAQKQTIHRQVGQLLWQHTPPDEQDHKIFDIVNQLNLAVELTETQAERNELAQLNLMAGKKAKGAAAYEPALNYLETGIELLLQSKEEIWSRDYDLALALYVEAAEAAYLNGDFTVMETLAKVVLQHAKTLLDKVKVYEVKIQACQAQNKPLEAVNTALSVLKLLGLRFPNKPNVAHILLALLRTKLALIGKRPENLINLPQMTDLHKLAAIRILAKASPAIYVATPNLLPLVITKMVDLSLKYGNAAESTTAYGGYGVILCGAVGDIEAGYQFGQLALQLVEKLDAPEFKARVLTIANAFIRHWKDHAEETLAPLHEAYQSGLEVGDLDFAVLGPQTAMFHSFFIGHDLTKVSEEMAAYRGVIVQLKQELFLHYHECYWQAVLNFMGRAEDPTRLVGEVFDEDNMLSIHQQANDVAGATALYIQKLMLSYLFHAHQQALEAATAAEKTLDSIIGTLDTPLFYLYDSLNRLALYPQIQDKDLTKTKRSEQKRILKKVAAHQKKMKKWAKHAPMNYLHKYHLVEAERARVLGQVDTAREHYEQAINLAQENQFLNEEALANELAGTFYLAQGQSRIAQVYLREAHYAYLRWGAMAKVHDLEQRYPQLLILTEVNPSSTPLTILAATGKSATTKQMIRSRFSSERRKSSALDFTSVVKALQAISGEIEIRKLLTTLMKIVIENAGAERSFLILDKAESWVIEAEGTTEQEAMNIRQSIPIEEVDLPLSLINYVARTKEHIVLNDASHEGQFTQDQYITTHRPKSVLCSPLSNRGKLVGMLYLENNLTTEAFTADRLQVLNLLSSQAAISIKNAQLYTDLQSSEQKYRTVFEDSKDVIFITTSAGQVVDMNPAGLSLFGYTREELMQINIRDLYANPDNRDRFRQQIEQEGVVRDLEITYLRKDGTKIDCLETATLRRAEDGTLLGYHGIIRDITAQKQAEQERLRLTAIDRELSIARELQQSLLPPAKPNWPNLDVICYSTSAREVGGDFYSYRAFPPSIPPNGGEAKGDKYALTIGDVSGKGVSAALLMSTSLSLFDAALSLDLTPAERLAHLDRAILPYIKPGRQNCALLYVELQLDPKGFEYPAGLTKLRAVNAGSISPYIKRKSGQVEELEIGGFALGHGIGSQFGYQDVGTNLAKGDIVIMTSDGLVEANNAAGNMFGFERLELAIATGPTTSAEAMLEHLKAQVTTFVAGAEPHDDLTIVVIQV